MSLTSAQGTEEWKLERIGKVTASRIADVMAKTKTGYGASRGTYMGQLIAETLTQTPQDIRQTAAMVWGVETEALARRAYEAETGVLVEEVGFIPHPRIALSGASPDGLAGEGLVEIKCPETKTHIDTLLARKIPAKYQLQMQWQMACTQRTWCDFVSFDPRMPENLQLWISRLSLDVEKVTQIEMEVGRFLVEMNEKLEKLRSL